MKKKITELTVACPKCNSELTVTISENITQEQDYTMVRPEHSKRVEKGREPTGKDQIVGDVPFNLK